MCFCFVYLWRISQSSGEERSKREYFIDSGDVFPPS
jgi:hypothetical protein